MRIGLVSNWGERCGVAEYAQNLVDHLDGSGVEVKEVGLPLTFEHVFVETADVDVIHFNYASGIFRNMKLEDWPKFKSRGQKTMLTFHDSSQDMIQRISRSGLFDRMVVHEKVDPWRKYIDAVTVIPQPVKLVYIPQTEVQQKIGVVGFPFPWKGFWRVAMAAKRLGLGFMALLSESDQVDVKGAEVDILRRYPAAEVNTEWLVYRHIIQKLAECSMTVFDYDYSYVGHPLYGISAAVRMAMAAKRPLLVSNCRQFRDLTDYEDEIYFIQNGLDETIHRVMEDIKNGRERKPNRILLDMNWTTCAEKYLHTYKELVRDTVANNA